MEIEFDVQIKSGDLYDYLLRHHYSTAAGISGTFVGLIMFAAFYIYRYPIYLLLGIMVTFYLPWTLFRKSRLLGLNPAFKNLLHYKITAKGVEVSQNGLTQNQDWNLMHKAVATQRSIILYTGKNRASIFPRRELKDLSPALIQIISENMPPNKVKIHG